MDLTQIKASRKEAFEKEFGTAQDPKEFSLGSIGVSAGCDDCYENVKTRQKHCDFDQETIDLVWEEAIEEVIEYVRGMNGYIGSGRVADDIEHHFDTLRSTTNGDGN